MTDMKKLSFPKTVMVLNTSFRFPKRTFNIRQYRTSNPYLGGIIMDERKKIIPALRYNWLTSLYDPIMRWTIRVETFKHQLVTQANIRDRHRVLERGRLHF